MVVSAYSLRARDTTPEVTQNMAHMRPMCGISLLTFGCFLGKCWYISQTWSIWVGTDKKCLRCKLLRQKVMTLTAGLMPTRLKDGPTAAAGGRIMSCYGKFIVSNSNFTLLSFFHPDFNGFHTSICLSMPFIFG